MTWDECRRLRTRRRQVTRTQPCAFFSSTKNFHDARSVIHLVPAYRCRAVCVKRRGHTTRDELVARGSAHRTARSVFANESAAPVAALTAYEPARATGLWRR